MALDRSTESISAQNEFDLILGQLSKTCEGKFIAQLTRKFINWA